MYPASDTGPAVSPSSKDLVRSSVDVSRFIVPPVYRDDVSVGSEPLVVYRICAWGDFVYRLRVKFPVKPRPG